MKLKPRKCTFFKREVEFLGKLVSGDGIRIAPDKIETVEKWPIPINAKQLMSFLGFMNYHRSHIPSFAEISADLYTLTNADSFVWTDRHQYCFNRLKQLATTAPALSHPTPDGLFILDTDASGTQVAGALSQVQDGVIKPTAFASHVLMKQHRNYCTTRKELLAIVKFCRQFRHYLLGRFLVVRTDHNSIVWLTRFKNVQGQLARWLEELSQYNFRILHRRGLDHINAGRLSRIEDPLLQCDCYLAGDDVKNLPCGGCAYCSSAHKQWSRFNEDVDDVVPLAVRNIESVVKTSQESKMHQTRQESKVRQTSQESKVRQTSQASEIYPVSQISNWTDGLSSTQLREIN